MQIMARNISLIRFRPLFLLLIFITFISSPVTSKTFSEKIDTEIDGNNGQHEEKLVLGNVLTRKSRSTSSECGITIKRLKAFNKFVLGIAQNLTYIIDKSSLNTELDERNCNVMLPTLKQLCSQIQSKMFTAIDKKVNDSSYFKLNSYFQSKIKNLDQEHAAIATNIKKQFKDVINELKENLQIIQNDLIRSNEEKRRLEQVIADIKLMNNMCANTFYYTDFLEEAIILQQSSGSGKHHFSKPQDCKMSTSEFSKIKDLIQNLINSAKHYKLNKKMLVFNSTSVTLDCKQTLNDIGNSIGELSNTLNNFFSDKENTDKISILNTTYGKIIVEKRNLIDFTRKSNENKQENIKEKLSQELQKTKQSLTVVQTEILKLKEVYNDLIVKFIAILIECGDIQLAMSQFGAINQDVKLLPKIISENSKSGKDYTNILNFIKNLYSTYEQDVISFQVLFENIKNNNDLGAQNLFTFMNYVEDDLKSNILTQKVRNDLLEIKKKLDIEIDRVFLNWGYQIRHNNYNHVTSFFKSFNGDNKEMIPMLIKNAYAKDVKNVKNILKFINDYPYINGQGKALNALFDEMKQNNDLDTSELFLVALNAYLAFQKWVILSPFDSYFNILKNKLPDGVRRLIWDPYVVFKNIKLQYTLYGSTYGNIYTYPHNNYEGGKNQMWEVYYMEEGAYYRFKNVQNERYLYADDERHIYSKSTNDYDDLSQDWIVVPRRNGEWYSFHNRMFNTVLDSGTKETCSSSKDCCCSTARAWKTYSSTDQEMHWEIQ